MMKSIQNNWQNVENTETVMLGSFIVQKFVRIFKFQDTLSTLSHKYRRSKTTQNFYKTNSWNWLEEVRDKESLPTTLRIREFWVKSKRKRKRCLNIKEFWQKRKRNQKSRKKARENCKYWTLIIMKILKPISLKKVLFLELDWNKIFLWKILDLNLKFKEFHFMMQEQVLWFLNPCTTKSKPLFI